MTERIGIFKAYIKGPRWARVDEAIKDGCWELGLNCEVERSTTLLRETVRFKVEGPESKLITFKNGLESVIKERND